MKLYYFYDFLQLNGAYRVHPNTDLETIIQIYIIGTYIIATFSLNISYFNTIANSPVDLLAT